MAFREIKFCTGFKNIANPTQSVKNPGVIKSSPETNKKIPPLISSVGMIPCIMFCWALNNKFIPCLLTKKIPTRAVTRIIAIVFKTPILDPMEIKIAISIIAEIILFNHGN